MAHGYLLFGPFVLLGPQRNTAQANLIGLLSACGLIIILTACLSIYGTVSFKKQFDPDRFTYATANLAVPESLKTIDGWSQFAASFFVGGMGGAFFAYLIYDNLDLLQAFIMLHLIFCICFWALVFSFTFKKMISGLSQGFDLVKKLHQVPCSKCAYFTGDYRLKCPLNPANALTEEAIGCRDFQDSYNCNFNNFQASKNVNCTKPQF